MGPRRETNCWSQGLISENVQVKVGQEEQAGPGSSWSLMGKVAAQMLSRLKAQRTRDVSGVRNGARSSELAETEQESRWGTSEKASEQSQFWANAVLLYQLAGSNVRKNLTEQASSRSLSSTHTKVTCGTGNCIHLWELWNGISTLAHPQIFDT